MKKVIAEIEFTIPNDDIELASFAYGDDDRDAVYERTKLFASPAGTFYFLGGGGSLTMWRVLKGDVWDFDVSRVSVGARQAQDWVDRYAPHARPWITLVMMLRANAEAA